MGNKSLVTIAGVAIVTLAFLIYLAFTFEAPEGVTTVTIPPPARQPEIIEDTPAPVRQVIPSLNIPPVPAPAAEPEVLPLPEEVTIQPDEPETQVAAGDLPPLNESDGFVLTRLRDFQNGAKLINELASEQLVRSFVVFADSLSRGNLAESSLPYKPLQQTFPVRTIDDNLYEMTDQVHTRFDDVIDTFMSVDTEQVMMVYKTLSPLFRQAYRELGQGDADFDETVRQAITSVLEANEHEGPFQLVKPSVMYIYADSSIEDLNALEKQLIRLGPENTRKLKTKLREFLALL